MLGRLLNYLLVPLWTRLIVPPDNLAIVHVLYAWAALLNVLLTYGMETAFFRFSTDPSYASAEDIQTVCTAKSTCRVNLREGSIDNSSSQKASFTSYGQTATFLIVPQQSSDVTLTVHVGQDTKTIQLSDLLPSIDQLQTGKQLSVSLAVKEGKVELEGAMIEGWGNQGSIDGSIIM